MTREGVFWSHFALQASEWRRRLMGGSTREVFDEIDRLFHQFDLQYMFDITSDDRHGLLIVSPEGNVEVALKIDRLLEEAPLIPGWRFLGRRQRKDLADAAALIETLYLVDIRKAKYFVKRLDGRTIVIMYLPDSTDLTDEERRGLANNFLWHAIGEDASMTKGISCLVLLAAITDLEFLTAEDVVREILSTIVQTEK